MKLIRIVGCVLVSLPVMSLSSVQWRSGKGHQFGETTITVSSVLQSPNRDLYGPKNLFDAENGRAWCMDYNSDRRPWVKIELDGPTKFQRFYVKNGFNKDKSTFNDNYRAKKVLVTADNFAEPVIFRDTQKEQIVQLSKPVKSNWVKFTVLDNYPSKKHDYLCVTGITVDQEQFNYS